MNKKEYKQKIKKIIDRDYKDYLQGGDIEIEFKLITYNIFQNDIDKEHQLNYYSKNDYGMLYATKKPFTKRKILKIIMNDIKYLEGAKNDL